MGYRVTLFESKKELGGLLTHGFPSYRLPREVVERDLGIINKMGIEIKFNTEVGKDVSSETLRQSTMRSLLRGYRWNRTDSARL